MQNSVRISSGVAKPAETAENLRREQNLLLFIPFLSALVVPERKWGRSYAGDWPHTIQAGVMLVVSCSFALAPRVSWGVSSAGDAVHPAGVLRLQQELQWLVAGDGHGHLQLPVAWR